MAKQAKHMARMEKIELINRIVRKCWDEKSDRMDAICEMLAAVAEGTQWEEDARSAIQGVNPFFFQNESCESDAEY